MAITQPSLVISVVCLAVLGCPAIAQQTSALDASKALADDSLSVPYIYNLRPGTSGRFDCSSGKQLWVSGCFAAEFGVTTTDFDRVDDARAFTSEALFAQSALRLGRPLTSDELRSIARTRNESETRDHVTLSWGDLWPSIDLFSRYRTAKQAQITNFFMPTQTNSINVLEYGFYTEKTFTLPAIPSATVGLGYSRADRDGLVEFLPKTHENVDQYSARLGMQTGTLGTRTLIFNAWYDYQNIDTVGQPGYSHNRSIYGGQLFFKENKENIESSTGATQYVVGVSHDIEQYGTVDVPKNDYFAGLQLYGTKPFAQAMPIDFWIIPALLTSSASNDGSQANAQFRTNLTMALHLVDRGAAGSFETMYLSFPFRHDVAVQGPSYFENYRVGFHLNGTTQAINLGGLGSPKFRFDIGYDFQSFYNIGKPLHLFGVRLSADLCGDRISNGGVRKTARWGKTGRALCVPSRL